MPTAPTSYLQVAELWRRDPQTDAFVHAGGYYAGHSDFGEVSRTIAFRFGQGLIGRCAQTATPLLLDQLAPDTGFLRTDAARAAGLTVGLALPVASLDGQPGVLSLFFSHQRNQPSAGVEVWDHDADSDRIGLRSAHHGVAEDFRRVSAQSRFRLGQGLPGRVIDRATPELLERLDRPRTFLRAIAAESAGFVQAIGLPCFGTSRSAVVMLGHHRQSVVDCAEIWKGTGGIEFDLVSRQSRTSTSTPAINRGQWLQRALQAQSPVIFQSGQAGNGSNHAGGLVVPFRRSNHEFVACVLAW